ncbi:hypothetical protein G6M04_14580 [Agrobacterium rhizogenes]|uniref:hypothetical protein n=1 Tax=Rhizobium rhizogenes TaxID=359 RepID=UPI001573BF94|nr:hypothetical protein [Rhizobium rhizogenes]NTG48616.1 hypothetical protein [Rhizobium rhizogenes]
MKKLMATAAIILGCAIPALGYTLNDHEMKLVRTGFGPDPKFGDVKAAVVDGNVMVCGHVDAKNQYGQYMGDALFAGALLGQGDDAASFSLLGDGINPTSQKANEILCRQNGISF